MAEEFDWNAMANRGAVLMHRPTGIVGKCVRYFDGVDVAHPTYRGVAVEFEAGHVFMAQQENFVELTVADAEFFGKAFETVRMLSTELASYARTRGVSPIQYGLLLASAMKDQAGQLQRYAQAMMAQEASRSPPGPVQG